MKSKAWNWSIVQDERWIEPSEDIYYYLHKWSKNNKGKRLLDLGCGLGRHSILFSMEGFDVTAFDLSETAISSLEKYAVDNHLNLKTITGDMKKLPFRDNSFDYIVSYHVISHTDTNGVFSIFNKLRSMLSIDGEVFLTLGCQDSTKFKTHKGEWIDSNTLIKDQHDHEYGIPHFYANNSILEELLKPFDVISIKQSKNVDLNNLEQYTWHYFINFKKSS